MAPPTTDGYKRWKYQIPGDAKAMLKARPLGSEQAERFFKTALNLVESGEQRMQDVLELLASDGGLYHLKQLLNQDFESYSDTQLKAIWTTQLGDLCRLLSHESVLRSLVVEADHKTLIKFLYGIDGHQAVQVFKSAARFLASEASRLDGLLESCMCVLAYLFTRCRDATTNTDLKTVTETMLSLSVGATRSRSLERIIASIRKALKMESADTQSQHGPVALPTRPTFTMAQDMPGNLSEDGRRHDNDSASIIDIQILPTLQEMLSPRLEYLPRNEPNEWHIPGIAGLIDRHFRLLREDSVGPLRDAAKFELERLQNSLDPKMVSKDPHSARTNVYQDVQFESVEHDDHKGVVFVFSFKQPPQLLNIKSEDHKQWWDESKRLAPESLVCLLSSDRTATFLIVWTPQWDRQNSAKRLYKKYPLNGNGGPCYVIAQLVASNGEDVAGFLKRCITTRSGESKLQQSIIEFPGVLLPAFEPTLSALQRMALSLDIPFADYLLPTGDTSPKAPAYATARDFRWMLESVVKDASPAGIDNESLPALLQRSSLDDAQQRAVLHSLRNQVALVQGPPGTGKSFIGIKLIQGLLDNRSVAKLGPIICVCYTNHALDQLLEHLADAGVEQIIRIGSKSKSDRLAEINIRVVAQSVNRTKHEKEHINEAKANIGNASRSIHEELFRLSSIYDHETLQAFLEEEYPKIHKGILQDTDDDGFQTVHHFRRVSPLEGWLHGNASSSLRGQDRQLSELRSGSVMPHAMTRTERQLLYNSWVQEITQDVFERLEEHVDLYKQSKEDLESILDDIDLRILSKANVIGITTSGLARSVEHLSKLTSKVLVVEEAGEVLEAHLLTAMLPSIEHMILIGDHQQLRPKTQNYDLSVDNPRSSIWLDVSMFERLINAKNGVPFVTLETQRRMHPAISELVRTTLYPNLQDAASVQSYPGVAGMRHRLFWMDHDQLEDRKADQVISTSHTNTYEVDMVAALVHHLVRQGVYRAEDIAVLTPYLGQLRKLRRKLSSFFSIVLNELDVEDLEQDGQDEDAVEDQPQENKMPSEVAKGTLLQALRLATVDNFQGEEAKVVIISLVRSNKERNCGFLRTSNRINVLLSRAMHGMYIIGNSKTSEHIPMWKQVLDILRSNGNIGPAIELSCPRHPHTPLVVTEPEQFAHMSPEAGCNLLCAKMLPCGHPCQGMCHADSIHNATFCMVDCARPRKDCEHPCSARCGEKCPELCPTIVENVDVELPCGHHFEKLQCWEYQVPSLMMCLQSVQRTVPGCNHVIAQPCCESTTDLDFICMENCGTMLPCGHACEKKCDRCRPRRDGEPINIEANHGLCKTACGLRHGSCSHTCKAPCHGEDPCPPCKAESQFSCGHSVGVKKCSEPCATCAEESCSSKCPHSACTLPSAAPCDWMPCSKRCENTLSCSHQCPSLCGEVCPSAKFCRICASDKIKGAIVDHISMQKYGEIDLSIDPCIVLGCGHIFTVEGLDRAMELSAHYKLDYDTGNPVAIKDEALPLSADGPKTCPTCRASLVQVSRYGRIIRRSLLDQSTIGLITWSNQGYLPLAQRLQKQQTGLQISLSKATLPPGAKVSLSSSTPFQVALKGPRYNGILRLGGDIATFMREVAIKEEPFQRLRHIVEEARRREQSGISESNIDQTMLQVVGKLMADLLILRAQLIIVTDVVSIWENMPADARTKVTVTLEFSGNRKKCDELLQKAQVSMHVPQQAEALVFWAHFAALEISTSTGDDTAHIQRLKNAALLKLDGAEDLCDIFPGQTSSVSSEVAGVRKMVDKKTIGSAEMRMVVASMTTSLSSTAIWHRCINGHAYTSGDCGQSVEKSTCPHCGAGTEGQDHKTATGVTQADRHEGQDADLRV